MKILEKGIDEIKEYENNPRRNDKAVDVVAKSIKKYGFRVPIVIDKDGVIAAGHTRFKAAKKLGMLKVPCVIADELNDESIRAFRLADNKVAEVSTWAMDVLDKELSEISADMSEFGFALEQQLQNTCEEISLSDFDDDEFDTECPYCGYKFSRRDVYDEGDC